MKTYLTILFCFVSLILLAQTTTPAKTTGTKPTTTPKKAETCYDQWYSLFKERGAAPVADGTHEVIISLRNQYDYAECFFGKVDVKDGKMVSKLLIQKVDGSYEEFDKKVSSLYQNTEGVVKEELRNITNGMSETLELTDGERIKLFFYKSLGEKQKANKKALPPSALIKN